MTEKIQTRFNSLNSNGVDAPEECGEFTREFSHFQFISVQQTPLRSKGVVSIRYFLHPPAP
jgi:hypothetical protein